MLSLTPTGALISPHGDGTPPEEREREREGEDTVNTA